MPEDNPRTEAVNQGTPDEASAKLRARQKSSVIFACSLLALAGFAVLVLPLEKIPYPMRIGLAAIDLITAATLWLIARQKFKGE